LAWKKFLLDGDSASPSAHASTHQDGGSDEINIAGLSGEPAELTTHKGLATGVHGAGTNYLALAPAASHLVRAFTRGWTANKLLKGAGVDTDPTEISGWQVVNEVILSADTDHVDFTNLNINADKFYILFLSLRNPQTSDANYRCYVEGDYTDTNYYAQHFGASGTSVWGGRDNFPWFALGHASNRVCGILFVFRDPDGYFKYISYPTKYTGSTIELMFWAGSRTATVTNITSIRIYSPIAGGIGANSVLTLCKPRTG
jgi:hypothetical protein